MPADLATIPDVDRRLRRMLAARGKVIATSAPQIQPKLTEHWWAQVDELLERRLRLEQTR